MQRFVLAAVCFANVVLLRNLAEGLAYSNDCITPSGNPGKCVPTRDCEFVLEQLRDTNRDSQWLNAFRCRDVPGMRMALVCCPELKSVEGCGRLEITKKIVGGDETGLTEFPWVARLQFEKENKRNFQCGGSLINERYVATAAHCFLDKYSKITLVRLGDWDIEMNPDCIMQYGGIKDCNEEHQDVRVSKVIAHENFSRATHYNDIALLKLERPVRFSRSIAPVCIPTAELAARIVDPQEQFEVTGFGITESGVNSKRKLKVTITGQDMSKCATAFWKNPDDFADSQICAGGDAGKDSCEGDSGGPLMIVAENRWHMMGLVSYGPHHCGQKGVPAIYTRVGSFLRWAAGKIELETHNDRKPTERYRCIIMNKFYKPCYE